MENGRKILAPLDRRIGIRPRSEVLLHQLAPMIGGIVRIQTALSHKAIFILGILHVVEEQIFVHCNNGVLRTAAGILLLKLMTTGAL